MTLFDIIYNFISENLLNSAVEGVTTYNQTLTLILTHTSIILIYVVLVLFVVSIFKFVSNLFCRW